MIKIENYEVVGWEHAIRGMRNPMNSWEKSDSEPGCEMVEGSHEYCRECDHAMFMNGETICPYNRVDFVVGFEDYDLAMRLRNAGADHRKFMRYIDVYADITAPLYWWKEFKTYRRGRQFMDDDEDILEHYIETNSCSTMHKIHTKKFEMSDFSTEHLLPMSYKTLGFTIKTLNEFRDIYLIYDKLKSGEVPLSKESKLVLDDALTKKNIWWQMIQLLPSSYNQLRTVKLNYEVLFRMYHSRKNHKLDEWVEFCKWIETLPYSEIITCSEKESE